MRVLLDTNAYSGLMRGDLGVVDAVRLSERVYLCWTVVGELLFGFLRGERSEQNVRELLDFTAQEVVSLLGQDYETCEVYARLGQVLRGAGSPIPTNDHWIAATAVRHGLTLLSRDRHFAAVPGLQWRGW